MSAERGGGLGMTRTRDEYSLLGLKWSRLYTCVKRKQQARPE